MLTDVEAETSSVEGAWGMGRSIWSGVAEGCSVGGEVDMGSIDFAQHSASIWSSIRVPSFSLAPCCAGGSARGGEEGRGRHSLILFASGGGSAVQASSALPRWWPDLQVSASNRHLY